MALLYLVCHTLSQNMKPHPHCREEHVHITSQLKEVIRLKLKQKINQVTFIQCWQQLIIAGCELLSCNGRTVKGGNN